MAKIAVIKTGGKQYKVSEGKTLKIEKIKTKEGDLAKFNTLMVFDKDLESGAPSLGEKVEGKVIEHGRGKKISVIKYKSKVRYKRNVGHRQHYTKIEITKIA